MSPWLVAGAVGELAGKRANCRSALAFSIRWSLAPPWIDLNPVKTAVMMYAFFIETVNAAISDDKSVSMSENCSEVSISSWKFRHRE